MAMKRVRLGDAALHQDGNILVSAAAVTASAAAAPFTARWCVVKPGTTSHGHMHLEAEAFFILSGRGAVKTDEAVIDVEGGDAVILSPLSRHTIENSEHSGEDLVFLTIYWIDGAGPGPDVEPAPDGTDQKTRVLVFATPPTPNGDLHLGHLSGPYLAADVWTRYLRARGVEARFVTGTDDHQTYVEHKARQLRQSAHETALGFGTRIRQALTDADVRLDQFVQPADCPEHRERTAALFRRLYETGKLQRQVTPSLYCTACQRHLFEVYVRGSCPHCGSPTSGNGCEECGRPNECADLVDPVCHTCGQPPVRQSLERIVFPLEPYRERLQGLVDSACMSTHLRTLCQRMLADPLPVVSVSHVSDWGIPVPIPGFAGQVIWSWLEMAGLYLGAAEALGWTHGSNVAEGFLNASDVDVVQFFGFDNGYFKVLLLTAVYAAIDDQGRLPKTFVTNEFYRLDSRKFSTSSNHLVSVLDFMQRASADLARFHLCYTRPELEQTNFTSDDFALTVRRELVEGWQGWLHELGRKVRARFGGAAPDIGLWTPEHRVFENRLRDFCARVEGCLSPAQFSLARLTRLLSEMVQDARRFGVAESHWAAVRTGRDLERTGVALELAAARTLAITAGPIMPRFARELWEALGCTPALEEHGWRSVVGYVPAGAAIELEREFFPTGPLRDPDRRD